MPGTRDRAERRQEKVVKEAEKESKWCDFRAMQHQVISDSACNVGGFATTSVTLVMCVSLPYTFWNSDPLH